MYEFVSDDFSKDTALASSDSFLYDLFRIETESMDLGFLISSATFRDILVFCWVFIQVSMGRLVSVGSWFRIRFIIHGHCRNLIVSD
jgi:hypothetical protein